MKAARCILSGPALFSRLRTSSRCLSSTPAPIPGTGPVQVPEPQGSTACSALARYIPRFKSYSRAGVVSVAVGGTVLAGWKLTQFMASLSFSNVAYFGFAAGFLTAGGTAAAIMVGSQIFLLRPETVFRAAIKQVRANQEVQKALGGVPKPASFKAYSFDNGNLRISGLWEKLAQMAEQEQSSPQGSADFLKGRIWKPRQLQLLFQVSGPLGHAMVSAQVQRIGGKLQFNSLCVDIMNSGQRIVLSGTKEAVVYQGHIRLR